MVLGILNQCNWVEEEFSRIRPTLVSDFMKSEKGLKLLERAKNNGFSETLNRSVDARDQWTHVFAFLSLLDEFGYNFSRNQEIISNWSSAVKPNSGALPNNAGGNDQYPANLTGLLAVEDSGLSDFPGLGGYTQDGSENDTFTCDWAFKKHQKARELEKLGTPSEPSKQRMPEQSQPAQPEIARVLNHCVHCHTGENPIGTKLPLTDPKALKEYQESIKLLTRATTPDDERMPRGRPALTDNERKTLLDWIEKGSTPTPKASVAY